MLFQRRNPEAQKPIDSFPSDEDTAIDSDVEIDDNYVSKTLAREKPLPPITWKNLYKNLNVISCLALTIVPALAIYGAFTTRLTRQTFIWSVVYYFFTGLGITAGYHRFWAHRAYNASTPLQYFFALGGAGAVEGSIKWWSRGHRAHHRYTDTDLDPYSVHKGFLYSHIGWMLVKPRRKIGFADVSDLDKNPVVRWQHKYYVFLIITMGFIVPTLVAGLGWGDYRGGFFFAGAARLLFVHHSTFCVNSLAHWLGDAPFDDRHTPRDHFITALVTNGEGYHNFHHQFPADYRNAIKWYQYDPTRRLIEIASFFGLASELKTFPDNEVKKGMYNMKLKALNKERGQISWPKTSNDLPILTWDQFVAESKSSGRSLIAVGGFIHDVSDFIEEHPGGYGLIKTRLGKDATAAFHGGVYNHSRAANNLLSMLRVGVLEGGLEVIALKENPGMKTYDGPAYERELKAKKEAAAAKGTSLPQPLTKGDDLKDMSAPAEHDLSKNHAAVAPL